MKSPIGLVLIAFFIFFSCSDPVDPAPVVVIDGKFLVNTNGWVVTSSTKDDGQSTKDLFAHYTACVADNVYKFLGDGVYSIDEGLKKCDTTDLQTKEGGEWKLKGSSLTLSPGGDVPYQFTISSLTEEKLVFTYPEIGATGIVNSVTTITFKPSSGL